MADEITKIQVTIRRFLYEVRGVRHEASEAGKWLDRFCTTLEFQDLDPDPEAYASSLIDEARKYSEVKRYAARVRIAKAELVKEGTKRPTRQQIEERLKEIYAEEEITAAAATREGADESTTGCKHSQDAPNGNAGEDTTHTGNGGLSESGTSCNHYDQEANQASTEALDKAGAGEVTPESVSAPSPALPAKHPHGEFGNVILTTDEYIKLCEKCQDADSLITELDQYIESQGKTKKYKSHYATLLNWSRRKAQEAKPKQGYMTSDDNSKKNYEESKARLEAMFSKGRKTA